MIQRIWNNTKELGFLIIKGVYLFFAALILLFYTLNFAIQMSFRFKIRLEH